MFNPLIKILLGLSGLLLLLLVLEWYWLGTVEPQQQSLETSATFEEIPLPQLDFARQTLENTQDMLKRPLFMQGRRPLENNPEEVIEPAGDIDEFLLMGVYQVDDKPVALLKDKQQQRYEKKTEGESIAGWEIKQVLADRIVIERQGHEKTVLLRKPKPKTVKSRTRLAWPRQPVRTTRKTDSKKL
jgi:type II secretory pathway component PulC